MLDAALDVLRNGSLTYQQAFDVCESLVGGAFADVDAARLLTALADKGESAEEVQGFVASLLSHAMRIPFDAPTIDVCGTGGSGLVRFNVSTTVAFVLAAEGLTVAKHGNRGSRAPNGSFDLLEHLGVPVELGPQELSWCLEETGLGFIYARRYHPAMKHVAAARALVGQRTIFNLAGPLSNPSRVTTQIVGTSSAADAERVAKALYLLGRERGIALTGSSGMDDVDLTGEILVFDVQASPRASRIDPAELGLARAALEEMACGDASANAELFVALLDDVAPPCLRDTVCFSAAVALVAAGRAHDLPTAYANARTSFSSGRVRDKFLHYRSVAERVSRASSEMQPA